MEARMCWEFQHGLMDISILILLKFTNIRQSMLKLKTHSGFHDLFDSDMSKSTNRVVYFDWKTIIYIYVCGKCRTQFMLPMAKTVTFTGLCANEIIPSINRSFFYKTKKGRHVWFQCLWSSRPKPHNGGTHKNQNRNFKIVFAIILLVN
jgi:hypothetical protein